MFSAFNIADPKTMQDACHIMNIVNGPAHHESRSSVVRAPNPYLGGEK